MHSLIQSVILNRMKIKTNRSDNVFSSITRKIVKEELAKNNSVSDKRFTNLESRFDGLENRFDSLENRFDSLEDRFDDMENRFITFKNEIMNGIDKISGMFMKHNEEYEIIRGDHARLIKIEEYLKI